MNKQKVELLSKGIEMLMAERAHDQGSWHGRSVGGEYRSMPELCRTRRWMLPRCCRKR